MKNTSDESDHRSDESDHSYKLNIIIASGLVAVAVIGIIGLIVIAATKGIPSDSALGPIIAIISTAVGAMAGVLTTQQHPTAKQPAPPTTQQPPAPPTTQQPPAPPTTQQPPAPPNQ